MTNVGKARYKCKPLLLLLRQNARVGKHLPTGTEQSQTTHLHKISVEHILY